MFSVVGSLVERNEKYYKNLKFETSTDVQFRIVFHIFQIYIIIIILNIILILSTILC